MAKVVLISQTVIEYIFKAYKKASAQASYQIKLVLK